MACATADARRFDEHFSAVTITSNDLGHYTMKDHSIL